MSEKIKNETKSVCFLISVYLYNLDKSVTFF